MRKFKFFLPVLFLFSSSFSFGQVTDLCHDYFKIPYKCSKAGYGQECIFTPVFLPETIVECPGNDYHLEYSDEFEGTSLNNDLWQTKLNNPPPADRSLFHAGIHEGQLYSPENVYLNDGKLILKVKQEDVTYSGTFVSNANNEPELVGNIGDPFSYDFHYTSGAVIAKKNRQPKNHLKIETRLKQE